MRFRTLLKGEFDKRVVTAAYEITDPTVDSQVVNLKSSGAEALLVAGTPKFAAQAIRKASEIGWKPTILLNYPSSSVGATLKPAGLDKSIGVIVGTINKDPTDPKWDNNEGMKNYRAFVDKYMPGIDIAEHELSVRLHAGHAARANHQAVRQRSVARKYHQAGQEPEGCRSADGAAGHQGQHQSAKINMNLTQMRLQRWTGTRWDQFSDVLDAASE